jgi:hypothetical protein
MSVSSTCSINIGFRGGAVPLEQALDETIRDLQKHLNNVQMKLREIAVIIDQDPDFREEVKLSDDLDDNLREMEWLFVDLRSMAYDLISAPDLPEDKAWFKVHKDERKSNEKKLQAEHTLKVKEDRKNQKMALDSMDALGTIEE